MSRRKATNIKLVEPPSTELNPSSYRRLTRSAVRTHSVETSEFSSAYSQQSVYARSEVTEVRGREENDQNVNNGTNEYNNGDGELTLNLPPSMDVPPHTPSTSRTLANYPETITNNHLTPEEEVKCRHAAEEYIKNCKYYDVPVDPSVVIALQTGWKVLQPSSRFSEGSMLPLKNILEEHDMIKKLNLSNVGMQDSRFRAAGNGNANARILNFVLQKNKWIEELDLSNNGLDDDGIREISEGLKENSGVQKLNLARNHFGTEGASYLNEALQANKTIHDLDLSSNALGYHSINSLLCICGPRKVNVVTQGNYVFEEILNSVSHGIAFLGSVVGANILIADATDVYATDYHFWAAVIYSFALMFLFLSSCLFHSFFMLPSTMRILQILDHIGIYLVIAGSYTPFFMISLHHYTSANVLLIFEWIAAFLGATFAACSDLNSPTTNKIELCLFLAMGFGVFLVWDILEAELSRQALILLFLGGLLYIVGIFFFILGNEYKPIYHVIWHIFVVAAAAVHWFAVYFFVLQVSKIENSPTRDAVNDFVDSVEAAANLMNRTFTTIQQEL